jgi:hypothetical protein
LIKHIARLLLKCDENIFFEIEADLFDARLFRHSIGIDEFHYEKQRIIEHIELRTLSMVLDVEHDESMNLETPADDCEQTLVMSLEVRRARESCMYELIAADNHVLTPATSIQRLSLFSMGPFVMIEISDNSRHCS